MTTNVPQPVFGATGFVVPTQEQILAGVILDYQEAFGADLNLSADDSESLTTPQGQLCTSTASIVGNVDDTFQLYTNLVDPAYSFGRMQDAIGRIYFIERLPSQPTVVVGLCFGLSGVTIPVGALAIDGANNIYTCTGSGIIGTGGTTQVSFSCNNVGPIAVPETLSIYQAIPGWDSVSVVSGVEGQNTETRQEFELRRQQTVAANSVGSLPSILGSVLLVSGVLDAYVTENDTNAPATVGGTLLAANSLYVAVSGGAAQAVGQAIWSKKAPGCAYNGNMTVTVQDTNSGYSAPFPSYQVSFETPSGLPVLFAVNLANNAQIPANAASLIQAAIISAFAGGDGGPRARIGSTIFASRFYAPVAALGSWVQIRSLEIGSNNESSASITGSIGDISASVLHVTAISAGTVTAGQTVSGSGANGTGIVVGTTIVAQLSGTTGGVGTYSISSLSSAVLGPLFTAVANLNSVTVNINQEPTVAAPNINVTVT